MKQDETIGVRLPGELLDALERERQRASRVAGVEVKMSAVVRALLTRSLRRRRARAHTGARPA
jgi:hypothetical protein